MRKKLLASDWDGTLYRNHVITKEDTEAIKKFRQQGHYFALCTGRTPNSIKHTLLDFPDLEIDGFVVASGGAIYQAIRQHPIEIQEATSSWIPAKDGAEFVRHFHDTGKYTVYWSTNTISYGLLERDPSATKAHHLTLVSLEDWCKNPEDVLSFGLTPFARSEEDAIEAVDTIAQKWGKVMTGFRNLIYVDVSASGTNKGVGINNLNHLLENKYTCYAIGDAQNDIPMFQGVGRDYAFRMVQGAPELETFASRAVSTIAECIELLLTDTSS